MRADQWKAMHLGKQEQMERFKDRKFGMFIHFGLYSLLAGEWKGKRIEEGQKPYVAEWIMHAFKIDRAEYQKLIRDFNPTDFSPRKVAALAKKAGMKYVVITSKHHEGFALFDSKVSDFTVMMTPYGKDIIRELRQAVLDEGLEFGLYYSHSIDWMDGGDGGVHDYKNSENRTLDLHAYNDWDPSPSGYDEYMADKAFAQVDELLTAFPDLCNIWFDVAYYIPEKYSYRFYQRCHALQPQALISMRVGNEFGDIDCPGDNVIPVDIDQHGKPWESVGTMNNSWGYKHYDQDWKGSSEVLLWLVDIVSKGGNYMLNIGPDGQGNIPVQNVRILEDVGEWLRVNGEAIYGTRPYTICHEGPLCLHAEGTEAREASGANDKATDKDWWFTQRTDKIYAITLVEHRSESVTIASLSGQRIQSMRILGENMLLEFSADENGVHICLPETQKFKQGFAIDIQLKN